MPARGTELGCGRGRFRPSDPLLRHLVTAVLLKLVVLTALWWTFIRDVRVEVDTERAAAHVGTAAVLPSATPGATQ